jgi:hypothetical protein
MTDYQRSPYHAPEPRLPSGKSWQQLEHAARRDGLRLLCTPGCVTILTDETLASSLVTITADDLVDGDADRVVRAATGAALAVLVKLER